jgi:hypothetical protein
MPTRDRTGSAMAPLAFAIIFPNLRKPLMFWFRLPPMACRGDKLRGGLAIARKPKREGIVAVVTAGAGA